MMECSIKVPNYQQELTSCMYQLQQKAVLCDAGLECKDGVIYVHKLVLISCGSRYLQQQVTTGNNTSSRIYVSLSEFTLKTVCCLVQTLYTGELKIFHENIAEFESLCNFIGLDKIVSPVQSLLNRENNVVEQDSREALCEKKEESTTIQIYEVRIAPDIDETNSMVDSTCDSRNVQMDTNSQSSQEQSAPDASTKNLLKRERTSKDPTTVSKKKIKVEESTEDESLEHVDTCSSGSSEGEDDGIEESSSNVGEILEIAKQLSTKSTEGSDESLKNNTDIKNCTCKLCRKVFIKDMKKIDDGVCKSCEILYSGLEQDQTVEENVQKKTEKESTSKPKQGGVDKVFLDKTFDDKEEGDPTDDRTIVYGSSDSSFNLDKAGDHRDLLKDCLSESSGNNAESLTFLESKINDKSTKPEAYNCRECSFSCPFNDRRSVKKHENYHYYRRTRFRRRAQHNCPNCEKIFITKCGLNRHQNNEHIKKVKFRCTIKNCKSVFFEKSNFDKHIANHKDPTFECRKCGERFFQQSYLTIHERKCINTFNCPHCSFTCRSDDRKSKRKHQNYHYYCTHKLRHPQEEHQCKICDKVLKTKVGLESHHIRQHSEKEVFRCSIKRCSREFFEKSDFENHVANHKSPNFACRKCGDKFFIQCQLTAHETICIHKIVPYVQCEMCGQQVRKCSLKSHRRKVHGIDLFKCYCGEMFSCGYKFKKHRDEMKCLPNAKQIKEESN